MADIRGIWNKFMVVVTVISLSSLADAIVKWIDFFENIIEAYRAFVYPIIAHIPNFVFMPDGPVIEWGNTLRDYYIVGLILAIAIVRAIAKEAFAAISKQINNDEFLAAILSIFIYLSGSIIIFYIALNVWPIALIVWPLYALSEVGLDDTIAGLKEVFSGVFFAAIIVLLLMLINWPLVN